MESYVFLEVLGAIGLVWAFAKMKKINSLNAW